MDTLFSIFEEQITTYHTRHLLTHVVTNYDPQQVRDSKSLFWIFLAIRGTILCLRDEQIPTITIEGFGYRYRYQLRLRSLLWRSKISVPDIFSDVRHRFRDKSLTTLNEAFGHPNSYRAMC